MKPVRTLTAALLLAGAAVVFSAAPAYADVIPVEPPEGAPTNVCADLTVVKTDTEGNPKSVEISAPAGNVITMYCVKAGSEQQGNGPLYFKVDPPTQTVTITYPDGKEISHYSYSYEPVPTPTPTPTPTPEPTPTPTTPPGGGGDGGAKLAETGFDAGWLPFVGIGALALGAALFVPRLVAKRR